MVPKEGRKMLLDNLKFAGTSLVVKLAKNDPAAADADVVVGDFTECDFDGYLAVSGPAFGASAIDGGGVASIVTGMLTWTAGAGLAAPQTIRCVYVTLWNSLTALNQLLWFERLVPTVTLSLPAEEFTRALKLQDTNYAP